MAIYKPFVNATIKLIERPQDSGPGGDTVTEVVVERNIDAHRQPFNAFATAGDRIDRTTDAVIANAENTFFFDLDDLHGEVIRIEPGDLITWESLRKSEGAPYSDTVDEVLRANIWEAPGLDRQHVELFTRGQAKLG